MGEAVGSECGNMTDLLTTLGEKYGTDKVHDHHYTPHYNYRFDVLRDEPITLLEIGVGGYAFPDLGGESLAMWRDYFPKGTIVGVDIHPKTLDLGPRVHIEHGDITDRRVIAHLAETYGPFDIVIDDGSHRCDDIMAAWAYLWEHVKDGGWYCVEDLQTAYWPEYGGSSTRTGETTIGWLYGLINHIHYADLNLANYLVTKYDETLVGLEISRNLAFIRKGDNTKPSNIMPPHPHGVIGVDALPGVEMKVTEG
jgi:hypothetical protein